MSIGYIDAGNEQWLNVSFLGVIALFSTHKASSDYSDVCNNIRITRLGTGRK